MSARAWLVRTLSVGFAGLVLAVAPGRAPCQEPFWVPDVAGVMERIRQLPCLPPSGVAEEGAPPPLIAWETADDTDSRRGLAAFQELCGEPRMAYLQYRILSLRFPDQPAYALAAERLRANLWYPPPYCSGEFRPGVWTNGADSPLLNPTADTPTDAPCAQPVALPEVAEDGDAPLEAESLKGVLPGAAVVPDSPPLLPVPRMIDHGQYAIRLSEQHLSLGRTDAKDELLPWLFGWQAEGEPLPTMTDIVRDSKHGRVLMKFGILPDPAPAVRDRELYRRLSGEEYAPPRQEFIF